MWRVETVQQQLSERKSIVNWECAVGGDVYIKCLACLIFVIATVSENNVLQQWTCGHLWLQPVWVSQESAQVILQTVYCVRLHWDTVRCCGDVLDSLVFYLLLWWDSSVTDLRVSVSGDWFHECRFWPSLRFFKRISLLKSPTPKVLNLIHQVQEDPGTGLIKSVPRNACRIVLQ